MGGCVVEHHDEWCLHFLSFFSLDDYVYIYIHNVSYAVRCMKQEMSIIHFSECRAGSPNTLDQGGIEVSGQCYSVSVLPTNALGQKLSWNRPYSPTGCRGLYPEIFSRHKIGLINGHLWSVQATAGSNTTIKEPWVDKRGSRTPSRELLLDCQGDDAPIHDHSPWKPGSHAHALVISELVVWIQDSIRDHSRGMHLVDWDTVLY